MVADADQSLFCFGLGYTARHLARALMADGWTVSGTCRTFEAVAEAEVLGIGAVRFDRDHPLVDAAATLARVHHLLSSVPPDATGDPVINLHGRDIAAAGLGWVGYLSTTGVYGDTGGARVDEGTPLAPTSERSRRRLAAETGWRALHANRGVPVHAFRLAGIYGPGRSALDQVRGGRARRIDRPGHLFSRIHVDDIVAVLRASMARPNPGAVYNVCDDLPAAPADVVAEACRLLRITPPPLMPFAEAARGMSSMAASFWRDNRLVTNRRIKDELGVRLRHPDYRAGLVAILAAGG